ncbi:Putative periplasmic protein [hydrothermal vent metagenome]|uniref:Putative periplasmic protein n=1 Tax=hydrothermal vent metagenome TaxID=652676 RepID=A0A1W1D4W3_9ZZZZ
MKKKILLLLSPILLYSQSFLISNIPLPRTYIQDLDPYECDTICLQRYLDHQFIFSFLAHAHTKLQDPQQEQIRRRNIALLNLDSLVTENELQIAVLLPYKKIGKYASTTMDAAFAYLITKNYPFELKSYKIENENKESINKALQQIQADGFNYVIAPLTKKGADNVNLLNPTLNIYFPTINKNDTNTTSSYLFYGGINYNTQSDLLLKEAKSPLVIFYDKSYLGRKLALYQEQKFLYQDVYYDTNSQSDDFFPYAEDGIITEPMKKNKVIKYAIARRTTNLEAYLKDNDRIKEGSFFLDTPIVKSGMIMSQLTLYDANATNILSTQINYDPLILSMTQYTDRKNMIIANSITKNNNIITETNALIGNDVVYDWINYTTTIGIDYFFHLITHEDRVYDIELQNNQMIYETQLIKPSQSRFIKINTK